jgi:Holliday junction resolvase-like predicted endonuclease
MNGMKEKAMGAVKAFLERKGYEIVDEAWQGPEGIGGIDLVAVDEDGTLVFVDVTVRIGTDGFPECVSSSLCRQFLHPDFDIICIFADCRLPTA